MYAIVYKTDGYPICRQMPGVSPDPVDRRLHPSWGPAEQAACLRRLDGWAHWPDAH